MRTATRNNQDALTHLAELRAVIHDSLLFSGPDGLTGETRHFFSTVRERFRDDENYILGNMRRGGPAIWGFEPFDDSVDLWAS